MLKLKVAGSTLNQIPMDWAGNAKRIRDVIKQARKDNVTVLCLPELCITGYGCEDAFFNPHVQESALAMLQSLLSETKGMFVSFGLPIRHKGVLFNGTAVAINGVLCGFVPKKALAGDGVHYEPRWFKAWKADAVSDIEISGHHLPFGDIHFDVGGIKIGFEICEEAWVANRPGAGLARRAVDVILNPSASHFAFGKFTTRKQFVCEGSRAFNVGYVYSNLVGNESGRIIFDGGVLIADDGRLVNSGSRFSYKEFQLTSAVIDVDRNRVNRERLASYQPDLTEAGAARVSVDFKFSNTDEETVPSEIAIWEKSSNLKEEEFSRAVALGLFDFLRKSHQSGFVISLSGGTDSAAVTLLCRLALEFANQELGLLELKNRLRANSKLSDAISLDAIARETIFCAYQATQNSSEATEDAAGKIALDANATFTSWNVDKILKSYEDIVSEALKLELSWKQHDIALQNIQARVRGPSVWMIANLRNSLLLSTSNRSEAAVGYATMDGDTCGGLSPIAGIDKNFLKTWAHWMSDSGPAGIRAFKSFESVFAKAPTAELRPQDQNQTDEDDLMPYDVLDQIERLAIRDKKSPLDVFRTLQHKASYPPPKLRQWTIKFFRLWCRSQWKRERYAPAFHLDDESLDPKTWCRFPILSSGFEEELDTLAKVAL
jgi:NAD+ synthase (glutamine-hydrolysing)